MGLAIQKQRKILRIEKPCSSNFVDQLCDLSGQPIDGGVSKEVMGTADVSDVPDGRAVAIKKETDSGFAADDDFAELLSLYAPSRFSDCSEFKETPVVDTVVKADTGLNAQIKTKESGIAEDFFSKL